MLTYRPQEAAIADLITEVERLRENNEIDAVKARVSLPLLVTEGNTWWGGDTLEERIRNNWMVHNVVYTSETGRLTIWYEEPSLKAHHPAWTEGPIPWGRADAPPVVWEQGTWLVDQTLRNGRDGTARIPDGQKCLREVFQAKCSRLLELQQSRR